MKTAGERGEGKEGQENSFDFFFNDTATTGIYTLSLRGARPICTNGKTVITLGFAYTALRGMMKIKYGVSGREETPRRKVNLAA